jgi:glycosyltransferase involved in cell wall biosynthesis
MIVSTLILTYNEASTLPGCLAALSWCDDIVVIDSGSRDQTVEIARSFGARVLTRAFDNFAAQRNFGLDSGALRNEWVLHLDADEIVTEPFAKALASLEPHLGCDAWRVPFKMILFGKWLRHAGMWPAYQVRIGHVGRLRFISVGHGQREALPPEKVSIFPEPLLHYTFAHGFQAWLEKHLRYANDEARLIASEGKLNGAVIAQLFSRNSTTRWRGAKALASMIPPFARPFARFVFIYFYRLGFLDGGVGFVYAFMLSLYEGMIGLLIYELRNGRRPSPGNTRVPNGELAGGVAVCREPPESN